MDTLIRAVPALGLAMLPGLIWGQTKVDEPIKTTVCELTKEPGRFNGKMVSVHGGLLIGIEVIEFTASECDG